MESATPPPSKPPLPSRRLFGGRSEALWGRAVPQICEMRFRSCAGRLIAIPPSRDMVKNIWFEFQVVISILFCIKVMTSQMYPSKKVFFFIFLVKTDNICYQIECCEGWVGKERRERRVEHQTRSPWLYKYSFGDKQGYCVH